MKFNVTVMEPIIREEGSRSMQEGQIGVAFDGDVILKGPSYLLNISKGTFYDADTNFPIKRLLKTGETVTITA